jgi:hypothetical protein
MDDREAQAAEGGEPMFWRSAEGAYAVIQALKGKDTLRSVHHDTLIHCAAESIATETGESPWWSHLQAMFGLEDAVQNGVIIESSGRYYHLANNGEVPHRLLVDLRVARNQEQDARALGSSPTRRESIGIGAAAALYVMTWVAAAILLAALINHVCNTLRS